MMKVASLFLIMAIFGIIFGVGFDVPAALDFGRIILFCAMACACIGMVTNIIADPSVKHILYRR